MVYEISSIGCHAMLAVGEIAFSAPILPGKRAALERFSKDIMGPRREEFADNLRRLNQTKETFFVENGPSGDSIIVYIEADDPMKSVGDFVASKHPFDLWCKEQILEITGIDFNNPPPSEPPIQVLRFGY